MVWRKKKDDEKSSSSDDDKGPGNGKNPEVDFKGEKRSNETHESKSDPESKLYRKGSGREAKLSFIGHIMMENKNGLAVDTRFGQAGYHAELEAEIEMAQGLPGENKKTIGADKHYDQNYFSEALKNANISSHVAQNLHARKHTSSIDGRTTRHQSYEVSQQKRKRIEEIFGWLKTIGLLRRPMLKGSEKLGWMFSFGAAVYNLVRIKNLCATQY